MAIRNLSIDEIVAEFSTNIDEINTELAYLLKLGAVRKVKSKEVKPRDNQERILNTYSVNESKGKWLIGSNKLRGSLFYKIRDICWEGECVSDKELISFFGDGKPKALHLIDNNYLDSTMRIYADPEGYKTMLRVYEIDDSLIEKYKRNEVDASLIEKYKAKK